MEDIYCIILAAGLGKRLGGEIPKALVRTRQASLIGHVLEGVKDLNPKKTVVVVGHGRELVEQHLQESPYHSKLNITFAYQETQQGTGDAVRAALPELEGHTGTVVITYADHPLFRAETLRHFIEYHQHKNATLSMISFQSAPPNSYGKIVRDAKGNILRITENKDCNPEERLVSEVNSGVYAVDSSFLKPAIDSLTNENAQNEYYLTDIVQKATSEGQSVAAFSLGDPTEAAGVNTNTDLSYVNSILAQRHLRELEESGVIFDAIETCTIEPSVTIQSGARIGPGVHLAGVTTIESGVFCEGYSRIQDTTIDKGAEVRLGCRIESASIGARATVGPFAHIRPGTFLAADVRIGNFVETKNAILDEGAKASHLSYLGDCVVGKNSNIGAGTITCNYDGQKKSQTSIGEGVFVGSNSALVAPVTIKSGALVGAGSVITKNVPENALALGRARQENRENWLKKTPTKK
jgi:bifunctional UDP-N-acetylglucosamine pyrophosphorylase/glucosamine-1-phosphate N-acetyltransferase